MGFWTKGIGDKGQKKTRVLQAAIIGKIHSGIGRKTHALIRVKDHFKLLLYLKTRQKLSSFKYSSLLLHGDAVFTSIVLVGDPIIVVSNHSIEIFIQEVLASNPITHCSVVFKKCFRNLFKVIFFNFV